MDLTELLEIPGTDADALYESFAIWAAEQGTALYPAQDEALLELAAGSHVILATPTGSGKSLVAVGAHLFALTRGCAATTPRRSKRW